MHKKKSVNEDLSPLIKTASPELHSAPLNSYKQYRFYCMEFRHNWKKEIQL